MKKIKNCPSPRRMIEYDRPERISSNTSRLYAGFYDRRESFLVMIGLVMVISIKNRQTLLVIAEERIFSYKMSINDTNCFKWLEQSYISTIIQHK